MFSARIIKDVQLILFVSLIYKPQRNLQTCWISTSLLRSHIHWWMKTWWRCHCLSSTGCSVIAINKQLRTVNYVLYITISISGWWRPWSLISFWKTLRRSVLFLTPNTSRRPSYLYRGATYFILWISGGKFLGHYSDVTYIQGAVLPTKKKPSNETMRNR